MCFFGTYWQLIPDTTLPTEHFLYTSLPLESGYKYTVGTTGLSFKNLWLKDKNAGILNTVYLFRIGTSTSTESHKYESSEELLDLTTSSPHGPTHYLMLRVVNKTAIIVQSYYGYYDTKIWSSWSIPLHIHPKLPKPKMGVSWYNTLLPFPKFRKLLTHNDGDDSNNNSDNLMGTNSHKSQNALLFGPSNKDVDTE